MDSFGRLQGCLCLTQKGVGCCTIGEHAIDRQAFPPCCTTPERLSDWEKVEMNKQIQALIKLGKMKNNDSKYACRVNLPTKRDGNRRFYGDYIPFVATLLWVKWEDETPTPKVRDLESSKTPECLELNINAQNTSH